MSGEGVRSEIWTEKVSGLIFGHGLSVKFDFDEVPGIDPREDSPQLYFQVA